MKFGFKPKKRSHSITLSSHNDIETDWSVIKRDLKIANNIRGQMIRSLDEKDSTVFTRLVTQVHKLYDLPEEYDMLHKMVVEEFGTDADIVPGSIGAYFGGCLAQGNIVPRGCSPLCAGSMPLTKETNGENSFCEYPVYLTDGLSGRSIITKMNRVGDSTKALVYVEARDISSFEGFDTGEVDAFTAQGVEEVRLISNDSDPVDLMTGDNTWISLKDIKRRDVNDALVLQTSYSSGWAIFGFVLILVLILVVIYLASSDSSTKSSGSKPSGSKSSGSKSSGSNWFDFGI